MWTTVLNVFAFKVVLGFQIKLASRFLTVSYTSTFSMGNTKPMMQAETKMSSSLLWQEKTFKCSVEHSVS